MTRTEPGQPLVTLDGARKSFGAIRALDAVTLTIDRGECLALVGHNGAGKSTLVNLINGALAPSGGTVSYGLPDGQVVTGGGGMRAAGIRAVHQELSLCPNLTVLENLRIPQRDLTGRGWRALAAARIGQALDRIFPGHGIHPRAVVGDLTLAERQMVEIAIGFAEGAIAPRLVILDEPTSSLDASIARQLLTHIRAFCAAGGAVIFISHMMGEVFDVASRIVVMKDGRITGDRPTVEFTRETLVAAMGHVAPGAASARAAPQDSATILTTPEGLTARKGEIVGLAGLAGHGQAAALARFYLGRTSDWRQSDPPAAVFVAGDRARDGLMPLWSIRLNTSLARLPGLVRRGLVDRRAEAELAETWKARIGIRSDDLTNPILSLSGGNQQKVLFARALATAAPVVVMDDPMRGVDVGTKTQVYAMIRTEAEAGRTFLWYSTETDEILLCDRVFVFRNGTIVAELTGDGITEAAILAHSFDQRETA
ncbi:sugar ABC transporter ATP-binding protein [Szabonella alba]|uniref:Sugar ABC transporter ATP-binding protein n=1 Tax=Szabonella alba TaxID=2804194 RepID=A0A8K0Y2R3_9RHOB|nr:sugar ABC transporter ATP-binding protein [Szabonella alba]MBL4918844.1 sugar ABC transporter ATP-binding protein [Szabonella alba]